VEQEHGQQRALPRAAYRQRVVGVKDLEWAQDAEFDAQPRDRIAPRSASPAPGCAGGGFGVLPR
jgi:hypothetical protein